MTYILSICIFALGIAAYLVFFKKQKKEELYFDKFHFVTSKATNAEEFFTSKAQTNRFVTDLLGSIDKLVAKFLQQTKFHQVVLESGYFDVRSPAPCYLAIALEFGFVLIGLLLFASNHPRLGLMLFVPVLVMNYFLVKMYLEKRGRRYLSSSRKYFVYFLDLMSTCMHSGQTFNNSLEMVSAELAKISVRLDYVIRGFNRELKLSGIEYACDSLSQKAGFSEVQEFISIVRNATIQGASIGSSFGDLGKQIRQFHFLETEERIGGVNAKLGIPLILLVMFPMIFEIVLPGILRLYESFHGRATGF